MLKLLKKDWRKRQKTRFESRFLDVFFLENKFAGLLDIFSKRCYNNSRRQEMTSLISGSAGIGRQARLRGVCRRRMGSSPIYRTRKTRTPWCSGFCFAFKKSDGEYPSDFFI